MNRWEIHDICEKYNIKNYTINDDMSIDVIGGVYLYDKGLKKLPLKFNKVSNYFNCSFNKLTTLEGSPKKVGDSFYCHYNKLKSLKHAPLEVNRGFVCHGNIVKLDYDKYLKKIKRMDKLKHL